jgi:aspartate ammonia-lyase
MIKTRIEKDTLGEKDVPLNAYYGIQTVRAIENFPISGIYPHPQFIKATAMIKRAAAEANMATGSLDNKIGKAIVSAAQEVIDGKLHDQFVVDVFQAGAGTSHNMNANEVIANRAIELLGGKKGDYRLVHPNDHVNMSQSTNDVFPTAMRVASLFLLRGLFSALNELSVSLFRKAEEFDMVIKSARTHLQDAVPIRLGQEFVAYGLTIEKGAVRIKKAMEPLKELGIGATAAGTGINTHPLYRENVVKSLQSITDMELRLSGNMVESTQSMADFVEVSAALKTLSVELIRIANDLRLMSSGPRTGLSEITLPPVQPGSSIMPGKVNPVMAEVLNMVAFHIIGNDLTISIASQAGQLELNVMMPVINFNLLQSIEILKNVLNSFTERCIKGITANLERCKEMAERSIGLATVLNPYIGYEAAAKVAKEALLSGDTIRDVVLKRGILSREEVEKILDPLKMT